MELLLRELELPLLVADEERFELLFLEVLVVAFCRVPLVEEELFPRVADSVRFVDTRVRLELLVASERVVLFLSLLTELLVPVRLVELVRELLVASLRVPLLRLVLFVPLLKEELFLFVLADEREELR